MKSLLISLFVYLFISSLLVHASVVLNEVAIQPNQTVELFNTASTSADISNWYIDDAGGSTYFTVPVQTVLAPQSCYLFSSDFNFNKASADSIRLFDSSSPPTSSSAKLIEQYPYSKAPDSGYSFIKKIDGGVEWQASSSSLGLFNVSLISCIPSPTPTPTPLPTDSPTLPPTPIPTSPAEVINEGGTPTPYPDITNIFISEVFPYPNTGEHEWIELFNGNDFQVNLANWYIDDAENSGSPPKVFSLVLDANSYGVVELSSSLFNNSGDVVRLLNSNKSEKDSMEYGNAKKEKSIGRISLVEDTYCEQEPSKNIANTLCLLEPTSKPIQSKTEKQSIISKSVPTAKTSKLSTAQNKIIVNTPQNNIHVLPIKGEVLGEQIQDTTQLSPTPYLSFVSGSYSLLTIVSVLIKMKNA